jgi:hypothetical protein
VNDGVMVGDSGKEGKLEENGSKGGLPCFFLKNFFTLFFLISPFLSLFLPVNKLLSLSFFSLHLFLPFFSF